MKLTLLLLAMLLFNACSPSETAPPPKLFKEQRDGLDKAKAVDAMQQQQSEAQHKEIEQQSQ